MHEALEMLAVHQSLAEQRNSNTVHFEGVSTEIRTEYLSTLDAVATLMARHRNLIAIIDAHTGVRAPAELAPMFTQQRANQVADELCHLGVNPVRLKTRAWGKEVALVSGWAVGRDSARAEIYLHMQNRHVELPPRPEYYELASMPEVLDEGSSGSDDIEASSGDD